jgi:hypothetical protein
VTEEPQARDQHVVDEFRANGGAVGGTYANVPLLLLHHTGAKSGAAHITPLAYLADGGELGHLRGQQRAADASGLVLQPVREPGRRRRTRVRHLEGHGRESSGHRTRRPLRPLQAGEMGDEEEAATAFPIRVDQATFERFFVAGRWGPVRSRLYGDIERKALQRVQPFALADEARAVGVQPSTDPRMIC